MEFESTYEAIGKINYKTNNKRFTLLSEKALMSAILYRLPLFLISNI